MKKWMWYSAAVLAVVLFGAGSSAGTDVGNLQPVQIVRLGRSGSQIAVWTDTGDWGTGLTLEAAVKSMQMAATGEIFLETADHLLLSADCLDLMEDAMDFLRPSCSVCLLDGEPDLGQVGAYFQIHIPQVTLMEYRAGMHQLETLKITNGRMALVS